MRRFFVKSLDENKPTVSLSGSEAKHIKNVLRLKPGDMIRLFDGSGCEYDAIIKHLSTAKTELVMARKLATITESFIQLIVAQGFLRQKKMDALVRQLSELGMTRWIPFFSERSVPRPDKKRLVARLQRWQKIVQESYKQCGRSILPEITPPVSFEEVLALGQACTLKYIFWENESQPLPPKSGIRPAKTGYRIIVVLGPEGGFTSQEIEKAKDCGFEVAGLGPRILRAETATIAACTLMQYIFGDMGKKC
jgi:16S rRNA (uracil1498-N3)-methyltransferase